MYPGMPGQANNRRNSRSSQWIPNLHYEPALKAGLHCVSYKSMEANCTAYLYAHRPHLTVAFSEQE
jgi:hypothetical protein